MPSICVMTTTEARAGSTVPKDLAASLVVFLAALPLCLGVALASGAPLIAGLLSGIIGGVVVGLLQLVGLLAEERLPHGALDEEQGAQHLGFAPGTLFASHQRIEDAGAHLATQRGQARLQLRH